MNRRTMTFALAIGGLVLVNSLSVAARAVPIRIQQTPAPSQVARSEAVFIGKVESLQEKTVKARHYQTGVAGEVEYQIAVVKIEDGLLGVKGLTHIQVAFIPQNPGVVRPPFRGVQPINLVKDQEGCFFVTKHPTESFYVAVNSFDMMEKNNANFEKYTTLAKKCASAIDDPEKGLKSKDAAEKLLAASMLLTRYRQPKFGGTKQEPIDAAESKLILETLADADWTKIDAETGTNPQQMFFQLAITPKDGFTQPQDFSKFPETAKKWLKDNAATYRIMRVVAEKSEKSEK